MVGTEVEYLSFPTTRCRPAADLLGATQHPQPAADALLSTGAHVCATAVGPSGFDDRMTETVLDGAIDLLLGGSCVGCARPGRLLCPACRAELPAAATPSWPTPVPPGLTEPWAAGAYEATLRAMVLGLKERTAARAGGAARPAARGRGCVRAAPRQPGRAGARPVPAPGGAGPRPRPHPHDHRAGGTTAHEGRVRCRDPPTAPAAGRRRRPGRSRREPTSGQPRRVDASPGVLGPTTAAAPSARAGGGL